MYSTAHPCSLPRRRVALVAETATRRIHRFLTDAKTDRNGHLYVERRLMPDKTQGDGPAGGTTGSLPGTPPVIEADHLKRPNQ